MDNRNDSLTHHQLSLKINYQESIQIIDITEDLAWADLPYPNILHVPASKLLELTDQIQQDIPVILVDKDEQRSRKLCMLLNEEYGFGNIYYLTEVPEGS